MKINLRMIADDDEDRNLVFDLDVVRVAELVQLCKLNDLSEVVIPIPEFAMRDRRHPMEGFVSQDFQDRLQQDRDDLLIEEDDVPDEDLDLFHLSFRALYLNGDGKIVAEVRFGEDQMWESEGVNLEEIEAWATPA